MATGTIAHSFARDLALVPDATLAAVGSRRLESAKAFTGEFGGRAHGSYEDLVADPDVDVVYLATPHSLHLAGARLAFEAGKHVLCEKPLTLSVSEAEDMVALARSHDRFLMEAMWTATHPTIRALRRRLAVGEFGAPRHLHAELGFLVRSDSPDRLLDPALGASALLDMGIYPLTVAHLLFGEALSLQALANTRAEPTGTFDLDIVMTGRYPDGVLATMASSMTSWSSRAAAIATDRGRIDLDDFHHPTRAVFTPIGGGSNDGTAPGTPVAIEPEEPVLGRGYGNEIAEVGRCLRAGLRESPLVPHAQTLAIMRQLDELRRQVGVVYS